MRREKPDHDLALSMSLSKDRPGGFEFPALRPAGEGAEPRSCGELSDVCRVWTICCLA